MGELPEVASVPIHHVDLPTLTSQANKCDPSAIRRPTGEVRDEFVGRHLSGVRPVLVGDMNCLVTDVEDRGAVRGELSAKRDVNSSRLGSLRAVGAKQ